MEDDINVNKILKRISDELYEQEKKPAELCQYAGIRPSTYSTWKKEDRLPQLQYIPAIAKFLGVTIDYLVTGEDNISAVNNNAASYSDTITLILGLIDKLDIKTQDHIYNLIRDYLDCGDYERGKIDTMATILSDNAKNTK